MPARHSGRPLTFGSFNNLSKVNSDVVALWARVLDAVPQSRLLLKSRQLADPMICDRLRRAFETSGVTPDRLIFKVHPGIPGKAALILRKKYSSSRNP